MFRRLFPLTAASWAAALPLATFAASRPQGSLVYVLTAAVYGVGAAVCHQRPERSLYLWGAQMPVCARCAGIYFGAAVAMLVNAARLKPRAPRACGARPPSPNASAGPPKLASRARAGGFSRPTAIRILTIGALPTAATIAYEWATGDVPSNVIRGFAGICLGAAVASIIQREVN